jgi:IS30 family transposase
MKIIASHLTLEQRQVIYPMRMNGKTLQEIANAISKNKSTISRELRREKPSLRLWNSMTALERAKWMHDQAVELRTDCKRGPRTKLKDWDVQGKVHEAIVEGKRSAEQTAMILAQGDGSKCSGSTIRRYAANNKTLKKNFPRKGRKYQKKEKVSTSNGMMPLELRPIACELRERYGDYEVDLIVCSQNTHVILTVRERKSRKMWGKKLENKKAETVRKALFEIFNDIPSPLALSATYDRGKEFSDLETFSKHFKIDNYVCRAYKSQDKGAIENGNGQIRRFFPSGSDLSLVTQEKLDNALRWINITPMLVLGKRSPNDVWFLACKNIKEMLH